MLSSVLLVFLGGFLAGEAVKRLGAPPLIGMILAGIVLGSQGLNLLGQELLGAADALRTVAVMVILMKAGLGLDWEKLRAQGTVTLRLGFLPALGEMLVISFAAQYLFGFDFFTSLLLGCILSAESPAVIVPGMLRLKSLGFGSRKGIPDAIMTGSALSDVLLLLLFSLLLGFLGGGSEGGMTLVGVTLTPLQALPLWALLEISLGLLVGYLAARLLLILFVGRLEASITEQTIVTASLALGLVVLADRWYYSGYLAVMTLGFFVVLRHAPFGRRIRGGFDSLWTAFQILLFVLLGATVDLSVLGTVLLPGLALLALGLLVGRMVGWFLSTWGSNWTLRERLFLLPGNMAKATVQAAVGALPLAAGIAGGETILALSALSIVVTAPLGAWLTQLTAPRLLSKDEVDPSKVTVRRQEVILAAIDSSVQAEEVLRQTAARARPTDARVIVLHIKEAGETEGLEPLETLSRGFLSDIVHEVVLLEGDAAAVILEQAEVVGATEIVLGRGQRDMGSVASEVIARSPLPLMVVRQKNP